jgi:hypothetical protein
MSSKKFILTGALFFLYFIFPFYSIAQVRNNTFVVGSSITPTVAPTQNQSGQTFQNMANCDRCGYCRGYEKDAPQAKIPSYWDDCRKCIYPAVSSTDATSNQTLINVPTPHPDHYYVVGVGCLSTKPKEFAGQVIKLFFSSIGVISFLFLMYGALILAISRNSPDRINHGKRIIMASIIGLIFSLSAIFIIKQILNLFAIPDL